MRTTIRDVARHAGVSPKTVSNVINGTVFVRPDTRQRVEAALAELDYVPNLSARGLRNGRSGVIALALPALDTAFSAETAHFFVEVAHEAGWSVQIEQTGAEPEREWQLLSRARSHLVDGLILNPVTLDDSAVVHSEFLPPVVLIGEVEQNVVDQVLVDSEQAAFDMTSHLLDTGRRRIAVVGAPGVLDTATARARLRGHHRALLANGLRPEPALEISPAEWSPAGGAEATAAFLDDGSGELPDAFFCFTDSMATGTLHTLWRRGIDVPATVAVAGFDDVADSRYSVPPLTTIGFDRREVARAAIGLLEQRIADRRRPPVRITLPHSVILRASTVASR